MVSGPDPKPQTSHSLWILLHGFEREIRPETKVRPDP